MTVPHMQTEETTLNNKAKKQNSLVFFLCGGFAITKVPPWARNWLFEWKDEFSTAEHLLWVGILYISRLILLYSDHLEGRQTVENHLVLVRIDVRNNDVINFQT